MVSFGLTFFLQENMLLKFIPVPWDFDGQVEKSFGSSTMDIL